MSVELVQDWKSFVFSQASTLNDVARVLEYGKAQVACIVDDHGCLLGILTEGDLRRAQLSGVKLTEPVTLVMNTDAIVARQGLRVTEYGQILREHNIGNLPLVDAQRRLSGIAVRVSKTDEAFETWAVVMAGGFGTRLAPLTDNTPKPLLPVGGIPILERVIRSLAQSGIQRIILSVFHNADQIRDYCGDGSRWNVKISYIQEETPCGTAGALSLIEDRPRDYFLIMNADILTNIAFANLIDFHSQQHMVATMCVYEEMYQIKHGVVNFNGPYVTNIDEKPIHSYFINAGIYVLNAEVLDMIPKGIHYDMPDLFKNLVHKDMKPAAYPIRDLWLDIGTIDDYERAQKLVKPDTQKVSKDTP